MDNTFTNIFVAVICISGPFFFVTTIALGITLYKQYKKKPVTYK